MLCQTLTLVGLGPIRYPVITVVLYKKSAKNSEIGVSIKMKLLTHILKLVEHNFTFPFKW